MNHPLIPRVRELLRAHRERSTAASERYALSMLGYSLGSPRRIGVAPQHAPVNETRSRSVATGERVEELMFDGESTA